MDPVTTLPLDLWLVHFAMESVSVWHPMATVFDVLDRPAPPSVNGHFKYWSLGYEGKEVMGIP